MNKNAKRFLAAVLTLALLAGLLPGVLAAEPDAAIAANAAKDLRYLALDDECNGPNDLYYQQKIMNPVVEDAFVLWYEGKNTKYAISWTSSDPGLLRINDVTHMAELTAVPAEDTEVTLTATMAVPYTGSGTETYPMEKKLVVKVPSLATRLRMDIDALTITNMTDVRGNLPLLKAGKYGAKIEWKSSNPAVITDEAADNALYDGGVVTRPAYGEKAVEVTLTAELSAGGETRTKIFPVTVTPMPAPVPSEQYDHFLFACYAERYDWNVDRVTTEEIYFGLSDNGMQWTNINVYTASDGKEYTRPILRSTVGDMGTRDPHIIRSHEGDKFYVLATDLHAVGTALPEREGAEFKGSFDCVNGNRDLVIWETNDLSDWGEPRLVKCNFASSGDTYAPEAIWDGEKQAYLVYWASKDNAELNEDGTYKSFKVGKIYYCYTRDFYTFSEPALWLSSTDAAMKSAFPDVTGEYDIYDTSISYDPYDGLYYRFGTKNRLYVQTSKSLSGPWSDAIALPGAINARGVEAPTCYQLPDGSWMLLGDNFRQYVPYKAAHLADFVSGNYESMTFEYAANGPRYKHGTILRITEDEYITLMTAYDDSVAPQEAPAAGEGYRIDYAAETITPADGYEISAAMAAGTAISGSISDCIGKTLYIRKSLREGAKASDWTALPVPARPAAPAASVCVEKAVGRITVTGSPGGCELSIGDGWGDNSIFTGLNPAAEYTVSLRAKATAAAFASEPMKFTVTTPAADGSSTVLPGEGLAMAGAVVTNLDKTVTVSGGSVLVRLTLPAQKGIVFNGRQLVLEPGVSVQFDDKAPVDLPDGGLLDPVTGILTENTHVVTFDSLGGSAVASVKVAHGEKVGRPADPTLAGNTFGGWYKDAEGTQEWKFDTEPVNAALTLYAKWMPVVVPNPFADVKAGAYYYDAVLWATGAGVTSGVSEALFAPDRSCSRAQMVTFLWRAAGSPEPTAKTCPFTDVAAGAYYEKAVLWAVEKNITKGVSATLFGTDKTVTRGQTVTFLWRVAGEPKAAAEAAFADVAADAYYAGAVAWAAEKNITKGTSATAFSPDSPCVRGQIVTFLYRSK